MDKATLRDAINHLDSAPHPFGALLPTQQAQNQFDALLNEAKSHYSERVDIQSLSTLKGNSQSFLTIAIFNDSVRRLATAINLRPIGSATELFGQIQLPHDASDEVKRDLQELGLALASDLHKSVLLLAGSISESLLLIRHPDNTEKGPGLKQLVDSARSERLLGRDTLRQMETLIDYRDAIHPRAESRNKTTPNSARSETAVNGLKLLCADLEDIELRYRE